MILTKEVDVTVHRNNKKYYNNLGYDISKDIITVKIEDLTKGCHTIIDVCCDYCGKDKKMRYDDYNFKVLKGGKCSCDKCYPKKVKENTLKKYGVDSTNKLKSTQEKKIKTVIKKYGVKNISEVSSEKVRKTKLKNHGDEKYNNREKSKQTKLKNHGDEKYNNREKSKQTCLEKYGVNHQSQNLVVHRRQQLGGYMSKKYNNLQYRGSYELDFIKYCELNNIEVINGPMIKYYYENKMKYYFSDFKLPKYNLVCEIKSTYYYNVNLKINLAKKDATIKEGYNFIFIFDKNYDDLIKELEEFETSNPSNLLLINL